MDRAIQAGSTPEQFSGIDYTAAEQLMKPDRFPFLYPVVMSGVYTEDNEEVNPIGNDIDFGLERILDGIDHYLQTKTQPGQSDK